MPFVDETLETGMKKLLAVVSRERSGSTAFAHYLATPPGYGNIYEAWNAGRLGMFYDFWQARAREDKRYLGPNYRSQVFHEYLEHKLAEVDRGIVLSLKYGHLDHLTADFNPGFRPDGSSYVKTPSCLSYLMERGAYVIHMKRQNKLRIFVSLAIAHRSGVWHLKSASVERDPFEAVEINPDHALRFVADECAFAAFVDAALAGYGRCLDIVYENAFADERICSSTAERVAAFLGEPIEDFDPKLPFHRTNPVPLPELITNFETIRAAFAGTPHAWMLECPET